MLILLPTLVMLFIALTLVLLRFLWPNFKYPWLVAALGSILAVVGVFLWQLHLPSSFSLPAWQPETIFSYFPVWLADNTSWPYALALATLATAVIWTSVVRNENEPLSWAGTLLLSALGILAVSAGNPLTLVLVWSAIDLVELVIMLRSTEGEPQTASVAVAFAVRLAGTGFLLWAGTVSASARTIMDFHSIPPDVGIYLLLAAGLRLGVLPLHLPYRKENVLRRGFGTTLRLVSAAASLALLARIPASALTSPLIPYLILLSIIATLYASWMWLRASDEIVGRPFWVLAMASLAVNASLRGNPVGSISWGVSLILCGGLIFLYSARRRRILWLPMLGLLGFASLPYTATASAWQVASQGSWLAIAPFLPAQGLLLAGFIRHTLHPGETSLESQERWVRVIYPAGLLFLAAAILLLGLWGWNGVKIIGTWWVSIAVILLATGFASLGLTVLVRLKPISDQWRRIFRLDWLYRTLSEIDKFSRRVADLLTSSLEGDGGLLWSFVLLVLILSILSTRGQ